MEVMQAAADDVIGIRQAARQRRYLADRVHSIADIPPDDIGHRAYCSEKATHGKEA